MTKKLKLRIEDLHVEQFRTEPTRDAKAGTVHGHWDTDGACTTGCTNAGCTQYCGDSMNANTAPCLFCPEMPITYSCDATACN
ncbi:MAG TPA: hypothetical protein VFH27_13945 [Longimicrobiaceae bacterium]|nr:hypothetical protein [Longimicrobiaceae bacterium]